MEKKIERRKTEKKCTRQLLKYKFIKNKKKRRRRKKKIKSTKMKKIEKLCDKSLKITTKAKKKKLN